MPLVRVAIVGRPNVGKSSLFNAIVKKRVAIVNEAEGITRDRIYRPTDFFGYPFELIDTGGIDVSSKVAFSTEIRRQAEIAIQEADSIIFVVDGSLGIHALDQEVAKILRRANKPVTLAINKIDHPQHHHITHRFASLGIEHMIPVSALQNNSIAELVEMSLRTFSKEQRKEHVQPKYPCIAICGRPNVGKSSLLNILLQEERSIVSPIAGTTRDAIDMDVMINDQMYTLIDTAGIRRRHKEKEAVGKFSLMRAQQAIERADVCLIVLNAQQGITAEEKKIIHMIEEENKACILLLNKWDLVKGFRMEHCTQGLEQEVPFAAHCQKLFISAKTGRNVEKIFPIVETTLDRYAKRISTGQLNKMLVAAMQKYHPPSINGKRLRIYYMAQVDNKPPHFVLFVNKAELMAPSYKRYLINELRKQFEFFGIPLVLTLRSKNREFTDKRGISRQSARADRDIDVAQQIVEQTTEP